MTDRKAQGATITYDALNRRTGATYAGGATTGWTYDLGGHLTQIVDSVGGTISRTYDGQNRVLGETTPQGTISYTYDTAGRRATMQAPGQSQVTFSYDNANRLTGLTQGALTYSYDLAGRVSARGGTLFTSILPQAVTSATYSLANRLTARTVSGVPVNPTWDANGSLTNDGTRTYTWDSRNRLTGIGGVATYSYDALGRRTTATLGGTATTFL